MVLVTRNRCKKSREFLERLGIVHERKVLPVPGFIIHIMSRRASQDGIIEALVRRHEVLDVY